MPKYVVSNSLWKADWNNTTILSGDAAKSIQSLKEQHGGNILLYGSAALVHALMPAGLIDEYNLMVFPTVLGRGTRQFPDGLAARLRLVDCLQFGAGIVLLRYSSST
jgi:dihydrofolate reductase